MCIPVRRKRQHCQLVAMATGDQIEPHLGARMRGMEEQKRKEKKREEKQGKEEKEEKKEKGMA